MERLLFEEFRGQQELDSEEKNRLDGDDIKKKKGSTRIREAFNDGKAVQRASQQAD